MSDLSRREAVGLLAAAAVGRLMPRGLIESPDERSDGVGFRVRTITAGTTLSSPSDMRPVEAALAFLKRSKRVLQDGGYEVQTVRLATQPLVAGLGAGARAGALEALRALDRVAVAEEMLVSIGPAFAGDRSDPDFAPWAAELARTTRNMSFTVTVASPEQGVVPQATRVAAEAMAAIARATEGGLGNFSFAAAANVPAGTPFFPVAHHRGPDAFAIGTEAPPLLTEAFTGPHTLADARSRLRHILESRLAPLERLGERIARRERRAYLGIDMSPAPGKDASIGTAIETLTGVPFGAAGTLAGCAAITDVLKTVRLKTCGYSGLMLPVLEDPVLARRAGEGRYSVRELLLYSSVCGTGLDVVPLPGDVAVERLAALIGDVAALATKLRKPLSARLFPVPGKAAGQLARFDDPYLTDCVVLPLE
jgi:uncharacterized protein (UPF0210 family)